MESISSGVRMTEKRYCRDCKYLGLDGMFGLICNAGGNNKNYDCPKYEEKGNDKSEKRYLLKYNEYDCADGEIIQADPYFIDTEEEYVDTDYFTIDGYPTMSDEQVLDLLNENEELKQPIEELSEYIDKRDYIESEHINNIYKEFGFDGVIEEVKGRLVYGTITEMDNLVRISTGGWSDDEALLDILISPMTRFHYHYVGYLVGGAFYFTKDKSFESFMKIRLIKDLEKGDK